MTIDLTIDEWTASTMVDRKDGKNEVCFWRRPRELKISVNWPRDATGKVIAHKLRELADTLEQADDV